MKKILALAIAVMMICVCATSVYAAEATLPDSDGTGWWVNHTEGIEVTEEGVEITFTNTTYETASANWNGPLYVLYTGDEAKVNGAGYVEYWVSRGDAYGWGNAGYYGVAGDLNTDINNATAVANMAAAGITFSSTGVDGWVGWDNFVAALKAGAEGKITAKLVDGKVNAVIEICGLQSTLVAPVDTSKPVYISLFAELAKLTNIKVITPDAEPELVPISTALAAEEGTFKVQGVVTLLDGKNIYIQDATGGIDLYLANAPEDLKVGDTVIGIGEKTVYNGLPELKNATYELSTGLALEAKEVTIDQLTAADICGYVKLTNLEITEVYDKDGAYSSPNITVKDANGNTIQLYKAHCDKDADGAWAWKVGDKIDVVAAVGVYKETLQLRTNSAADITAYEEPAPETPETPEAPETGDMIGIVVALLAISGTALVVLKKEN